LQIAREPLALLEIVEERYVRFTIQGLTVHSAARNAVVDTLTSVISQVNPEVIIISDESDEMLRTAIASGRKVIAVAHQQFDLPFGPLSEHADPAGADLYRRAARVATVSKFMADYCQQEGQVKADVVRFPILDTSSPSQDIPQGTARFITLISPCAMKGISTFVKIALERPSILFAAVPTWGTTQADLEALRTASNITLLSPQKDIGKIFAQTRVLVTPSWIDTLSTVTVEAMGHGIPTIGRDIGGIREAKSNIDFLIPSESDPTVILRQGKICLIPPEHEDISPWISALDELTQDDRYHRDLARRSAIAARNFVGDPYHTWVDLLEG
jgi:glycosyltransferase, family 1